ncbi:MAG: hypothetical protein Q9217_005550 [Psora testacea]
MAPVQDQPPSQSLTEPRSKRDLSTREKIILLESSKLNGCIFAPWLSEPISSDFAAQGPTFRYIDDTSFSLSDSQAGILDEWRPPDETMKNLNGDSSLDRRQIKRALDLVQDITTDCSVVASLCAITSHAGRGHGDLFAGVLHPWDRKGQKPSVSPSGKHILRFYFNGSYRKVVIDNRLPQSKTERKLYVIDRSEPTVIWPALVEKAYLKVRGGYDFPGSNSGTDLWVLTGWIPEQLFLQSDGVDRYALWQRVLKAFNYGDVLITMGTGKLTKNEERGLGLAGEHDYAVIDMKEHNEQRLFLMKNPWSEGTTWKGRIHYADDVVRDSEDLEMNDLLASDRAIRTYLTPGTFWMGLDHVFQSFESIYLNWNPGLFSLREDVHFNWDLTSSSSPEGCFRSNPQYTVRSSCGGMVWILLSKHFKSRNELSMKARPEIIHPHDAEEGFISLYAFNNNGHRVSSSGGAIATSQYVDSPNTLLKIDMPAGTTYTIVVSQQSLSRVRHTFTLSSLSLTPVTLAPAKSQYAHTVVQRGRWTASTAGGNAGSSLYHVNPQFSIKVLDISNVSLVLETTSDSLPVHVKLLWASGNIVRSVTTRDIIGDSGEHTKCFALAEITDVPAGTYTIVCSTFEQGQLGEFSLHVSTSSTCYVQRLPVIGAGRFVSEVRNAFFQPGVERLRMSLVTRRINKISVSARSRSNKYSADRGLMSPLKVAIELGKGLSMHTIAVSGNENFVDTNLTGAYIEDASIEPNMCTSTGLWIALERLAFSGSDHDELVDIEIHSDEPVEGGPWIIATR